jgi:hypothetical protein
MTAPRPSRHYTCAICGGSAYRRPNVAVRIGWEDPTRPLLHLFAHDWEDNPHDVIATDDGIPVNREGQRS